MQEFLDILSSNYLFEDISKVELLSLLHCLDAQKIICQKGQILHNVEDDIDYIGIVVCGKVYLTTLDFRGYESPPLIIHAGGMYGAMLACSKQKKLPLFITSESETVVFKIKISKITEPCSNACKFHSKAIMNLLVCMAEKYIALDTKIQVLTKRTIREKAIAYLQSVGLAAKSSQFEIPYNRQQLADYLSVDRSSLSLELSKLKELGAIDFRKNCFTIIDLKLGSQ